MLIVMHGKGRQVADKTTCREMGFHIYEKSGRELLFAYGLRSRNVGKRGEAGVGKAELRRENQTGRFGGGRERANMCILEEFIMIEG